MDSVVACFDAPECRSYLFPDSADCCCAKSRTAIESGFLSLRFRLGGAFEVAALLSAGRSIGGMRCVEAGGRGMTAPENNAGGCSLIVGTLWRYWAVSGERTVLSAERERRASEVLSVFSFRPFIVTGIPSIRNVLHMCVSSIIAREHNCTDSVKPELRDTDIFCFVSERGMKIRPVCRGRNRWKTLGPARLFFGGGAAVGPGIGGGICGATICFPMLRIFFRSATSGCSHSGDENRSEFHMASAGIEKHDRGRYIGVGLGNFVERIALCESARGGMYPTFRGVLRPIFCESV